MGSVFGKQTVAEPAFTILLNRTAATQHFLHSTNNQPTTAAASICSYEIRHYGRRFVAETSYDINSPNNDGSPFMKLANYIGVLGPAQNDGSKSIDMTAPVVMQQQQQQDQVEGTKIAMTAPVVIDSSSETSTSTIKTMQFMLPAEYDDISKIPKPTNPDVHIHELPPQVGAVHRYHGTMSDEISRKQASCLAQQLLHDGLGTQKVVSGGLKGDEGDVDVDVAAAEGFSEEYVLNHYQSFGYNPPFTIPYFRRNEVWIELTNDQVQQLLNTFGPRPIEN